ncbi:MAG: hypothetical protein ACI3Y0_04060 [Prevotella sp.]
MNTITIDSGIYQHVANYAAKRRVSVKSVVETFILSLEDKNEYDDTVAEYHASKILHFEELNPKLQKILKLSAPLKGTVPEWDLNGDIARNETLK